MHTFPIREAAGSPGVASALELHSGEVDVDVTFFYLILVGLLGGSASSKEYIDPATIFDVVDAECSQTFTNNDSVVLHNVTIVNGLVSLRVEYWRNIGTWIKLAQTSSFLASTLAYNPLTQTVVFNAGQLVFTVNTCE
jgi:hypothetical protein